jgi:hypothetical protein
MENQLFDCKNWAQLDTRCFVYYDCTLKQDIGKYKKGDFISDIIIDYGKGKLSIDSNIFRMELIILEN